MVSLTTITASTFGRSARGDQNAIVAIVGNPVLLIGYDEHGRAELGFDDPSKVGLATIRTLTRSG
jgi:hypothetical protein